MNTMADKGKPSTRSGVVQGLISAWPICLGYIPVGLAFGVIAQKAGLHPLEIGFMSLLVFAGSAQFIAISMLSTGAGSSINYIYRVCRQFKALADEFLTGSTSR